MKLNIIPLGGGKEIGANSYYIEFDNASFIIDAGSNPNKLGFESLPQFQHIRRKPNAIFISHAHFDHIGSLPVYASMYDDVDVFMTAQTSMISRRMLHNTISLLGRRVDSRHKFFFYNFYNHKLLDNMYLYFKFNKVECNVQYRIPKTNVFFKFYDAGHILGSSGILFFNKKHKLFYTGDFKLAEQGLEQGAEFASLENNVDTLITEATYAYSDNVEYKDETKKLIKYLNIIIKKGGKVLLPGFAVGRTQELLYLLSRAQYNGKLKENIPISVLGLGNAITAIYSSYFTFPQHTKMRNFNPSAIMSKPGPEIFIATNGMLVKNSLSFRIANELIKESKNGIIFTGYLPEKSYGTKLLRTEYNERIKFFGDKRLKTKHIYQVHLSAHAMDKELRKFISMTSPDSVIIVHSEKSKAEKFKDMLVKKGVNAHTPTNGELLYFDNRDKKIVSAKEKLAVITTVGISLLTNYKKRLNKEPENVYDLLNFIEEEKTESSAEIESIYKLKKKKHNIDDGRIYLLISDTKRGKFCADGLKLYFNNLGYDTSIVRIKGIKPEAKVFRETGLINLINNIADIIEKHSKNAVINATGGYKAEISYATLLGILYKVNVYYLFDDFKEIIDLPFLPINYDFKYLDKYYSVLQTIIETKEYRDADNIYAGLPVELQRFVVKKEKLQKYYLTAPGVAFMRAYKYYSNV